MKRFYMSKDESREWDSENDATRFRTRRRVRDDAHDAAKEHGCAIEIVTYAGLHVENVGEERRKIANGGGDL